MDQTPRPSVNEKPTSARVAGHFGELVQGRMGPDGPVVLVTLPCPVLETRVRFTPGPRPLRVPGTETTQVAELARAVLAEWAPGVGGLIEIDRPASPGAGAGSSTAELLACLRALAAWCGIVLTPEDEAARCHAIEGAVDPLMYRGNRLFASRAPAVVEDLPALPPLQVVGGFAGHGQRTNPNDQAFPDISEALDLLRDGLATGNHEMVADAARRSAELNQSRNPNPAWATVLAAGEAMDALGPVVSHTGSAIGMILPPEADPAPAMEALSTSGLSQVLTFWMDSPA